MDSVASAAIKYGSKRTRELLFHPYDIWFVFRTWLPLASGDPRWREYMRLKPYYQGTRALGWIAVLLCLPPFVIPFFAPFVGFTGIIYMLIAYVIVFLAVNILGLFVEACMDAIMALRYEKRISFVKAARIFVDFSIKSPGQSVRYMGAKLIADSLLMSAMMLLYIPAMYVLVWVLSYIVHALTIGSADVLPVSALGFLAVIVLGLAAAILSVMISVPASAFYGYYTEEAIRHMG